MRQFCLSILLFFPALLPSQVFAAVELGIGTNYNHFRYDEELTAPLKSSEEADFMSLYLTAKIYLPANLFIKASYETATGVVSQYDGTTQAGVPVLSTNALSFETYEFDLYVPLIPQQLYLFGGIGSRRWDRFLAGGKSYREIYSWNYLPLGVLWNFWNPEQFHFFVEASIRDTMNGKIKVITSENNTGGVDSEMNLGDKMGYKLSAPIRMQLSTMVSLQATPWYEHSEIGKSNSVPNSTLNPNTGNYISEPASKTDQYGVEALLQILL